MNKSNLIKQNNNKIKFKSFKTKTKLIFKYFYKMNLKNLLQF